MVATLTVVGWAFTVIVAAPTRMVAMLTVMVLRRAPSACARTGIDRTFTAILATYPKSLER
jgi:hypothetical protein